ncbi:MAG: DUF3857 domain-containing protein [Kiritimatiellaeota bacterium]|nr:DUF3857 domain-containing protein [Kiritimatiellota bacterium]
MTGSFTPSNRFSLCRHRPRIGIFLLTAGLLWFSQPSVHADLIVLRDGREYEGALLRTDGDEVVFRQDGKEIRYPRAQVVHIRLQKRRQWDEFDRAEQISDPVLKKCLKVRVQPGRYPGAGTATLYEYTKVRLRSPQLWSTQRRTVVQVLNEHGESASVRNILYRNDVDGTRIVHAITVRPDGRVLHLQDTAVQDGSVYAGLKRYDTVKRRRFALPEGKAGVILDAATETDRQKALPFMRFAAEFVFGGPDPVLERVVEVFVPAGCPFSWRIVNDPDKAVAYTRRAVEGGVLHRWERLHSPQTMPEPMMPPWADVTPRLVVAADSRTWEAIAAEYAGLLDRLEREFGDIPAPPSKDPIELWRRVSREVKGLGVPIFASGRVPRSPAETWKMRSGAPIDRAYLLYRWLQIAGVANVRWVWLRPRSWGRLVPETPALNFLEVPGVQFETRTGKTMLLVPGDDLDAPEEPAARLGGAACLIAGRGLDKLAVAPADALGTERLVRVQLDRKGNARVRERTVYRGAAARALRAWRRLTPDEIRNQVQRRVRDVDSRAADLTWKIGGDVTRNKPEISLEMSYTIPEFADCRSTLCALRPPWLEYEARAVGRDTRRFPLFWEQARQDRVTVEIEGPTGFAAYAGPSAVSRRAGPVQLVADVETRGALVRTTVTVRRDGLEAPASAYSDMKKTLETRAALGRRYWIWRRR